MEGIIALWLLHWIWKTTVEAAVNIVALVKGKPVVVGHRGTAEAEDHARYFTRGIGAILGGVLYVLAESARWGWAATDTKLGPSLRDKRARRRAKRRGTPPPGRAAVCPICHQKIGYREAAPTAGGDLAHLWCRCASCRMPGTAGDPLVEHGGVRVHRSCADVDESPDGGGEDGDDTWRCAKCGAEMDETSGARPVPDSPNGWACGIHFDTHCAACGHLPRDGDPLVLSRRGTWVHRSHTTDPRSGLYEPPPDGDADVADADGTPVAAVWEPTARPWASVHPH